MSKVISCGQTLLRGPKNSFDYVLRITSDDVQVVQIHCHRCVLIAHSQRFSNLIYGDSFWDMDIKVKPGFVGAVIELIQYMYLKDIQLISEREKILELCSFLEMPLDHFLIRQLTTDPIQNLTCLNIVSDGSCCISTLDFLKTLSFECAKLQLPSIAEADQRRCSIAEADQRRCSIAEADQRRCRERHFRLRRSASSIGTDVEVSSTKEDHVRSPEPIVRGVSRSQSIKRNQQNSMEPVRRQSKRLKAQHGRQHHHHH